MWVGSFFWISAWPNPPLTKMPEMAMKTYSMPMQPKSSGMSKRARTMLEMNEMPTVPIRPMPLHIIPEMVFCFKSPSGMVYCVIVLFTFCKRF